MLVAGMAGLAEAGWPAATLYCVQPLLCWLKADAP
jgi:hypothetical protein